MLPYFTQPTLAIGPLKIHAFGVLVAIAVLFGSYVSKLRAKAIGLREEVVGEMLTWVVVGGFLGGHVLDLLFYEPHRVMKDPLMLLRLWESMGSFGGFIGAVTGAVIYARRKKIERPWGYVDAIGFGFPFGWIFGRLGCFVAFDHPGLPTHLFFGQRYSDGVVRHNLGLEEAVFTMAVAGAFYWLARRKKRPDGFFTAALALFYAPVRFALDSLRIADTRYGGLTPGQYGSIALFVIGLGLLAIARRREIAQAPAAC